MGYKNDLKINGWPVAGICRSKTDFNAASSSPLWGFSPDSDIVNLFVILESFKNLWKWNRKFSVLIRKQEFTAKIFWSNMVIQMAFRYQIFFSSKPPAFGCFQFVKGRQFSVQTLPLVKEFFRTCNVLPFSCTHLALWRGAR